jgi:hypothetical protein
LSGRPPRCTREDRRSPHGHSSERLHAQLSAYLLGDFLRTGKLTAVLLPFSESLVVFFTIAGGRLKWSIDRCRPSCDGGGGGGGPALLRPRHDAGLAADSMTACSAARRWSRIQRW